MYVWFACVCMCEQIFIFYVTFFRIYVCRKKKKASHLTGYSFVLRLNKMHFIHCSETYCVLL
jgi:hypothetical protein